MITTSPNSYFKKYIMETSEGNLYLDLKTVFHSQLQILDLTSVLTNKLDFLEVSRKGVSSLKILLIEMEVNNQTMSNKQTK